VTWPHTNTLKLLNTNLLYKSPNAGEIKLLTLCVAKQKERPLRAAVEMSARKHTQKKLHGSLSVPGRGSSTLELVRAFLGTDIYVRGPENK
jgi:hypothetical protein